MSVASSAADFEGVRGGHGAFRAQPARLRRVPEDDLRGVVRQDPPGIRADAGFPRARSTLCRAMQRLARRAKPTRDALVEALRASPVVYADETGWKQGGRRVWLWVFTNLRETSTRYFRAVVSSRPPRCWGKTTRAPSG